MSIVYHRRVNVSMVCISKVDVGVALFCELRTIPYLYD